MLSFFLLSLSLLGKVYMEELLSIRVVQAVMIVLILAIVMMIAIRREEKGSI